MTAPLYFAGWNTATTSDSRKYHAVTGEGTWDDRNRRTIHTARCGQKYIRMEVRNGEGRGFFDLLHFDRCMRCEKLVKNEIVDDIRPALRAAHAKLNELTEGMSKAERIVFHERFLGGFNTERVS